jgi:hypothetical protein
MQPYIYLAEPNNGMKPFIGNEVGQKLTLVFHVRQNPSSVYIGRVPSLRHQRSTPVICRLDIDGALTNVELRDIQYRLPRLREAFDSYYNADDQAVEDLVAYIRNWELVIGSRKGKRNIPNVVALLNFFDTTIQENPTNVFTIFEFQSNRGKCTAADVYFVINELLARGILEQEVYLDKRRHSRTGYRSTHD